MNKRKGTTVRLTDEAHALLTEKAKKLGDSMKAVASEAVISLFKRELKRNEYIARISELEKELNTIKRYAWVPFMSGLIAGGCVVFLWNLVI